MCFNFNCICFNNSSTSKTKVPEKLVHFNDIFMLRLTFMIATIMVVGFVSICAIRVNFVFDFRSRRNSYSKHFRDKGLSANFEKKVVSNFFTKTTYYMSITDIVQSVCISINSRTHFTLHVYTMFVDVTMSKRVSPSLQMANYFVAAQLILFQWK